MSSSSGIGDLNGDLSLGPANSSQSHSKNLGSDVSIGATNKSMPITTGLPGFFSSGNTLAGLNEGARGIGALGGEKLTGLGGLELKVCAANFSLSSCENCFQCTLFSMFFEHSLLFLCIFRSLILSFLQAKHGCRRNIAFRTR